MVDHNEAMRLAEACKHGWLENVDPDKCSLDDLLSLLRQQAERIAELQSAHAIAVEIAAQYAAERDQLRAEVERLKREKANAIDKAGHMLATGMALSNCAFNLKQRVGETLSTRDVAALESSQRAWDAALDAARTTHKETE